MKQELMQKANDIIVLMYLKQQNPNIKTTKNLSNYIDKLEKLEEYQIIQQLIDDGLTNWEIRKGAQDDVVTYPIEPNLTSKGIEVAEFLIKPSFLRFLINTKSKIIALILLLLGLGIFSININININ